VFDDLLRLLEPAGGCVDPRLVEFHPKLSLETRRLTGEELVDLDPQTRGEVLECGA
jgi:hypothetical protein